MHLDISDGTRLICVGNQLELTVSVAWIKSEYIFTWFPCLEILLDYDTGVQFCMSIFDQAYIRLSHTLWDSYSREYSSWCHVLIRAQKLGKWLCLFSSLKSKRKNEGGRGSTLNPSLGWQRWFCKNPLEGIQQELGLCPCKRHKKDSAMESVWGFSVSPYNKQSCSDKHSGPQIPEKICSSEEPIFSEDHPDNVVGVMPTVTTSEVLISYEVLLSSSQPKASCLFFI